MNRTRGRIPIRHPGAPLPGSHLRTVAPEVHQDDPDQDDSFSGGYRLGALVAGLIALSCGVLAIAAHFLR